MSLRGVVRGRTIELEEDPRLPDGSVVEVELLRTDLQSPSDPLLTERLQTAAQTLLEDYLHDPELTVFNVLDGEAWHE